MDDDYLAMRLSQHDALNAIPAPDMLVDPAELAGVLEEPTEYGTISRLSMAVWTAVTLVVTIAAALWWAVGGH